MMKDKMKSLIETDSELVAIMQELTSQYGCHSFILYGSRARAKATSESDYDILGIRKDGHKDGDEIIRDAREWKGTYLDAFIYPESKLATPDESMLTFHG